MYPVLLLLSIFTSVGNSFGELNEVHEVGCDTFEQVVESHAFVDKSSLIEEFFNHERVLITAPHGSGKSINMDMLRMFCEIKVDSNGTRLAKEKTNNFKVFSRMYNKTGQLECLNIYKNVTTSNFFNVTFGEFPVLFLDFKELCGNSWEDFIGSFKRMLRTAFKYHRYLLKSVILDEIMIEDFNMFYKRKYIHSLPPVVLQNSGHILIELLYSHFKRRVIVFIDEFDKPVQDAIFYSGKDVDVKKYILFLQTFIGKLLKSNLNVERALINGCLKLSKVLTDKENNIQYFPFVDTHPFKFYYGFTKDEVDKLGKKLGLKEDIMTGISFWYDGYRVLGSNQTIFNVYTIVNFLQNKIFKPYWAEKNYTIHLEKLCLSDKVYGKIMSAVLHNYTRIIPIYKLNVEHILQLKKLLSNLKYEKVSKKEAYLYLNFLLDLGYFTVVEKYTYKTGQEKYNLTIPNNEIRNKTLRNLRDLGFLKRNFAVSDS